MAAGLTTEIAVHAPETDLIGVFAGEGGFEPRFYYLLCYWFFRLRPA